MSDFPYTVKIPNNGVEHYREVLCWLDENVGNENSEWKQWLTEVYSFFMFRSERHTMMFKLVWGGK